MYAYLLCLITSLFMLISYKYILIFHMILERLPHAAYGVVSSTSPLYPTVLSFFLLLDFKLFSQSLSFMGYPDIPGFYISRTWKYTKISVFIIIMNKYVFGIYNVSTLW